MIDLDNPKVNPNSPQFVHRLASESLKDPTQVSLMSDVRKSNLGFRQEKQIVTKSHEYLADYFRVPSRYHYDLDTYLKLKAENGQAEAGSNVEKENMRHHFAATAIGQDFSSNHTEISKDKLIEGEIDPTVSQIRCPEVQILIMIKSAIHHFEFRQAMRKSWKLDLKNCPDKFAYFFTVARSLDIDNQKKLENEMQEHQDILMSEIVDSYYNVTKKVVMGMHFVYHNCLKAEYVIHMDDDAYVSPIRFLNW